MTASSPSAPIRHGAASLSVSQLQQRDRPFAAGQLSRPRPPKRPLEPVAARGARSPFAVIHANFSIGRYAERTGRKADTRRELENIDDSATTGPSLKNLLASAIRGTVANINENRNKAFPMSKYSFSSSQRYAVFSSHGPRCYLKGCMVDMQSMQIDHIIPEHLLNAPETLNGILKEFGLSPDFDLNSYENWLPSCGPCNLAKQGEVFEPAPIIKLCLQKAANKADFARRLEENAVKDAALTRSINTICRANEKTMLTMEHVEPFISSLREHNPELLKGIYEYVGSQHKDVLGFGQMLFKPAEIPLTPYYKVVMEDDWKLLVSTPYGTGYVPKGEHIDASFYCGHCGSRGPWSGARCLTCGCLSDD
jgi:hypothetical protein